MAKPELMVPEAPGQSRGDLALAGVLSAAIFAFAHFQALVNPYVINDDVRMQIFWMQKWRDPALFVGDLLADYASHYVPWGVKGVYWLAAWAMSPIYFSKVLPGLLFMGLALCLFETGRRLGDRVLAWTTVSVYWLMPFFLGDLSGGLARAFAAPLLALFFLGWLARQPWAMGLALILQGLFIPYIFPVCAGAALLAWGAGLLGQDEAPPFLAHWTHWACLALAAGLVFCFNYQLTATGFGPMVGREDLVHRPEFGPRGRYPIWPVPSFFLELVRPWEFIAPFHEAGIALGVLVGAAILGLTAWGLRRVDWHSLKPRLKPALYLGLASLAFYVLARFLILKFLFPDRYLIYTLNLFYCLALALGLAAALRPERWPRSLTVVAVLLAVVLAAWRLEGVGLKDYSAYRALYSALASTPKDALIAGHPNLMDTIPTFARRRAFATYELAHPWSRGYWSKLKPRIHDFFQAYYADDPQEVVKFCRKYGIAFLIVDDRHFSPAFLKGGYFLFPYDTPHIPGASRGLAEREWCPFFAPFDEQIRRATAGRQHFALLSDQPFHALRIDQHIRLLDMRPWLSAASQAKY